MVVRQRFGRYQVIKPLAEGGMAKVYLGRALGAGGFQRLVAIKVMRHDLARDPDFVAMFLDEGRIAAGVHHPNVVATLDVQEGPEGLYMVLEYIAGCSLRALREALRRERDGARLPLPVVLKIMLDVLAGLHAAHELLGPDGKPLRVVHRDISPHNIMVGADGLARITDFGIARAESRLARTAHGEVKGKLAYMSPQQLRGEPVDRRCDLYAAGVVLWELLAGERLFRAPDRAELAFMVLEGTDERPSGRNTGSPPWLDEVCMKALAIEPAGRHATAERFAEALTEAARRSGASIATTSEVGAYGRLAQVDVGVLPPLSATPRPAQGPTGSAARGHDTQSAAAPIGGEARDHPAPDASLSPGQEPGEAPTEAAPAAIDSGEEPTRVASRGRGPAGRGDHTPPSASPGSAPDTPAPVALAHPPRVSPPSPAARRQADGTQVSALDSPPPTKAGRAARRTSMRGWPLWLAAVLLLAAAGWWTLSLTGRGRATADGAPSATASDTPAKAPWTAGPPASSAPITSSAASSNGDAGAGPPRPTPFRVVPTPRATTTRRPGRPASMKPATKRHSHYRPPEP